MTKYLYLIAALVALAGVSNAGMTQQEFHNKVDNFDRFNFNNMRFHSGPSEYWHRFNAYHENDERINQHNSRDDVTWTAGHNKFSDWHPHEFRYTMLGYHRPADWKTNSGKWDTHKYDHANFDSLPDAVDWRAEGLVTPVKDQGQCGSCWAFSSTGAMEGAHARANGTLVSLSEQELVDCVSDCYGCEGGWMSMAMEYVVENGGIDTEQSYPYQGTDQQCGFNKTNVGANFTKVVNITQGDCDGLLHAVATQGPVSVAINANGIMNYMAGIYSDPSCDPQELDHGVLVVGYGVTSDGKPYYIVKNSWGSDWGQDGYIYWDRSINNMCGICEDAAYPVAA